MAISKKEIDFMRNIVETRLNLPFIPVLSKKTKEIDSYGMDELLALTFDVCQKAVKGNVYKEIKEYHL